MQIRFRLTRRAVVLTAALIVLFVALRLTGVLTRSLVWPAAIVAVALAGAVTVTLRGPMRQIGVFAVSLLLSLLLVLLGQLIAGDDGMEMTLKSFQLSLPPAVVLLNVLCILLVQCFFLLLCNRLLAASVLTSLLLTVFFFANYLSLSFRGNVILLRDFSALGTAVSVLNNYRLPSLAITGRCVLLLAVALFCIGRIRVERTPGYGRRGRLVALCVAAASLAGLLLGARDRQLWPWYTEGLTENGLMLNFFLSIRDSRPQKPEGYSPERVAEIAAAYTQPAADAKAAVEPANIIVIMSEAYADLSVLGPLSTDIDPLENLHALQQETVSGLCLSSVFGGKTANPEWECLTGGTLAFLPSATVPYQQTVKSGDASVVRWMHRAGRRCVALHPYYATGWNRDRVFSALGFDEALFDAYYTPVRQIRDYTSDETFYASILDQIAQKEAGETLFLFGVSMQNHGGYGEDPGLPTRVHVSGMDIPKLDNYLTLLRETDRANGELIEALGALDEPTLLLFFGDHQPIMPNTFYEAMLGKPKADWSDDELALTFQTPWFLWANYDLPPLDGGLISASYLSALLMQAVGMTDAPYFNFLSDLRTHIPALYPQGYYSLEQQAFVPLSAAAGEEADWLLRYEQLQYNALFDGKNRNEALFPTGIAAD